MIFYVVEQSKAFVPLIGLSLGQGPEKLVTRDEVERIVQEAVEEKISR